MRATPMIHRVPWSVLLRGGVAAPRRIALAVAGAREVDDLVVEAPPSVGGGAASRRTRGMRLPAAVAHPWIARRAAELSPSLDATAAGEDWTLDTLPILPDWLRETEPRIGDVYASLAREVERGSLVRADVPERTRERVKTRLADAVASALFAPGAIVAGLEAALARTDLVAFERSVTSAPDAPHPTPTDHRALLAWLDASLLEIATLDDDDRIDHEALRAMRARRATERFLDAYAAAFGVSEALSRPSEPSVHVFVSSARDDGSRVLVTGGLSREAVGAAAEEGGAPFVELACLVPARERADLHAVAQAVLDVAVGARAGLTGAVAAGRVAKMTRPLGKLTHWVFAKLEGAPWDALRLGVPRKPVFLLAIGVTDAERARIESDGVTAVETLLRGTVGLATDPFRTVTFA